MEDVMLSKKLAAIAAASLITASSPAVAQSAQPLSLSSPAARTAARIFSRESPIYSERLHSTRDLMSWDHARSARSCAVRVIEPAAMFSSRWAMTPVPGIATVTAGCRCAPDRPADV